MADKYGCFKLPCPVTAGLVTRTQGLGAWTDTDGRTDGRMNGRTDRRTDVLTDRQMDGQMGRQTNMGAFK